MYLYQCLRGLLQLQWLGGRFLQIVWTGWSPLGLTGAVEWSELTTMGDAGREQHAYLAISMVLGVSSSGCLKTSKPSESTSMLCTHSYRQHAR